MSIPDFNSRSEFVDQADALSKRSVELGCIACKVCSLNGSTFGRSPIHGLSLLAVPQPESRLAPNASDVSSRSRLDFSQFISNLSVIGSARALLGHELFFFCSHELGISVFLLLPFSPDISFAMIGTKGKHTPEDAHPQQRCDPIR